MPRRPGPAPKENRVRRNPDTLVGKDGWTELTGETLDEAPPIPEWVTCSDTARAFYEELATSLPASREVSGMTMSTSRGRIRQEMSTSRVLALMKWHQALKISSSFAG